MRRLLFALALVICLISLHYGIQTQVIVSDEYFVFPERVWFPNQWRWLLHLLSFNQTRITWVGDYELFRPGLFLINWFYDVVLAGNRTWIGISAFIQMALGATGICLVIYETTKSTWLAITAILIWLTIPIIGVGSINWPHISPYFIPLLMIPSGVALSRHTQGWKRFLPYLLFSLATLFHESVSVAFLIFTGVAVARRVLLKHRMSPLFAPAFIGLTLFLGLLLINQLTHPSPLIHEAGSVAPSISALRVMQLGTSAMWFFKHALNAFLAVKYTAIPYGYLGVIFFLTLILATMDQSKPTLSDPPPSKIVARQGGELALCLALSIVLLYSLGRGGSKENHAVYYTFIFFGYLAWFVASLICKSLNPRKVTHLALLLGLATFISAGHRTLQEYYIHMHRIKSFDFRVTKSIEQALAMPGNTCFSGLTLFDQSPEPLPTLFNSLFFRNYCSGGKTGPWFSISEDLNSVEFLDLYAELSHPSLGKYVKIERDQTLCKKEFFAIKRPRNRIQVGIAQTMTKPENPECLLVSKNPLEFNEIRIRAKNTDPWPKLHNLGLVFYNSKDPGKTWSIKLIDNTLSIFKGEGATLIRPSEYFLPEIAENYELRILRTGGFCSILYNHLLIARMNHCPDGPSQVGWVTHYNGTPDDVVLGFERVR